MYIYNKMQVISGPAKGTNTIFNYAAGRSIKSTDQLPVPLKDRVRTDVCCTIATGLYAAVLFVMACASLNVEKLQMMTYPTDGMGRKCTLDNPNYNLLYFTSVHDPTKKVCVSECPSGQEEQLKCWPTQEIGCSKNENPEYEVQIYASSQAETRLGLFCIPEDKNIKETIILNSGLQQRFNFIEQETLMYISVGVAFGLGILCLILLKVATTPTVFTSIFLGGAGCFITSIFIFINIAKFHSPFNVLLIIFCVFLILLGIFIIHAGLFRDDEIRLWANYMHQAMNLLMREKGLVLLIVAFLVMMFGLFVLCAFQVYAFQSSSELQWSPKNVYYNPSGNYAKVMTVFVGIQLIWGFCFLKLAFTYLVSGCAVTKHFNGESKIRFGVKGLLLHHWGSVVAGSFLLNFFYLIDMIYNVIKPSKHSCCCDQVLGMVRSESMTIINLTGSPYCNSARAVEVISYQSEQFDGSQSISRYFKMGAHVLLALIATIATFSGHILNGENNKPSMGLIFIFVLNLFIVTYFIGLASDLAEGIFTCQLVEKYLDGENRVKYRSSYPEAERVKSMFASSRVNQGYQVFPTQH